MDFIITLFLYLGLVSSPEQVTTTMIDQNAAIIQQFQHDETYQKQYQTRKTDGSIGVYDITDCD